MQSPTRSSAPQVPAWIAVAAIVFVVLAIGGAAALMVARERPREPPRARPVIAVAKFENETGDPAHARTMDALSDAVVARLAGIGPSRVGVNGDAPILRRPLGARDWRAVARETGAGFLVSGQLQMKDERLSLLMQVVRLDDGTRVWAQRISRPAHDRLEALDADASAEIDAAVRRIVLR